MANINSRAHVPMATTSTATGLEPVLQPYIEAALADRTR